MSILRSIALHCSVITCLNNQIECVLSLPHIIDIQVDGGNKRVIFDSLFLFVHCAQQTIYSYSRCSIVQYSIAQHSIVQYSLQFLFEAKARLAELKIANQLILAGSENINWALLGLQQILVAKVIELVRTHQIILFSHSHNIFYSSPDHVSDLENSLFPSAPAIYVDQILKKAKQAFHLNTFHLSY